MTVHAKVVPTLAELKATVIAVPVQMLAVLGVAIAIGEGLTVIVYVGEAPPQPPLPPEVLELD